MKEKLKSNKIIFALLWLEGAVVSFNTACVAAVVPAIAKDLQRSNFEIAKVIPLYMIPYGIAALVYAPLVRRYSIKRIKTVCLFVFCLASLMGGLSNCAWGFFSSRIFAGIAASATTPIALILIGELAPKEVRGRMIGAFFSVTFIAAFLGVLLSAVIHWRYLFLLPALFAIINLTLVMLLFDFTSNAHHAFEANYLHIAKDMRVVRMFAYILTVSMVYHGIYNWLGVYFSSLDYAQMQVSVLLSLVVFSGIFGQPIGGWFVDKKGRVFAATMGLTGLFLATILLVKPVSFAYLAVILFLFGIGWTMHHNAVSTVLTDFPDKLRPELASLNSAVRFASGGLGVSVAGIFMQKSFSQTFLGLGVVILILAIMTNKILRWR